MLQTIKNAFRSISRKKLRSTLTVASITVGVTMVVIVTIISGAGTMAVNSELEELGISGISISTNAGVTDTGKWGITDEQLDIIRNVDEVSVAMPLMINYGHVTVGEMSSNSMLCGIDSGAKQAISLKILHGRMLSNGDINSSSKVCVIDESFALEAYERTNIVGKTVRLKFGKYYDNYRVVGVAKAGSSLVQNIGEYIPGMVYIPYSSYRELTGQIYFNQIAVKIDEKTGTNLDVVEEKILSELTKTVGISKYFKSDNLSVQRDRLSSLLDIVTIILTVISAISLVVSGIGIMTIMLVSVNERMHEIGIKKAIGATNGKIMQEFLTEAVIISMIGSVLGLVFGITISVIGLTIFGFSFTINYTHFLFLALFSVIIGAVFGVFPAIKAARLKPVDALRIE